MQTYETLFLVNSDLVQEDAMKVFEKFKEIITSNGGEIINDEFWGKLRMAYEIQNKTESYYFLIQFKMNGVVPEELEKKFKYDESVIRFIVIKIDGKKFKLKKRSEMTQRAPRRSSRPFKRESVSEQEQNEGNEGPVEENLTEDLEKSEE